MKLKILAILVMIAFTSEFINAQALINKINISDGKTVHLVFEEDIKYVDIGSNMVAVESFDNIVKIKAKAALMAEESETNITVISSSGRIFVGELQYLPKIHQYVVQIPLSVMRIQDSRPQDIGIDGEEGREISATTQKTASNEIAVSNVRGVSNDVRAANIVNQGSQFELDRKVVDEILSERSELNRIGDVEQGVIISLAGVYAFNDLILFKVDINNTTAISYDIDYETFIIEEKKSFDKRASQEEQLEILEIISDKQGTSEYKTDLNNVGPKEKMTRIYVLKKFNSGSSKKLRYEIWENMSYRTLNFDIPIKTISKAKLLRKSYKVKKENN